MKNKIKRIMVSILSIILAFSLSIGVFAEVIYSDGSIGAEQDEYAAGIELQAAEEGIVVLENNGVLPISTDKVAVFGIRAVDVYQNRMTRSLKTENTNITSAFEAKGYTVTSWDWLNDSGGFITEGSGEGQAGGNWQDITAGNSSDGELTDEFVKKASDADVAIYVISRTSTENTDRTVTKGDYYLTDIERANIEKMAKNFDTSIVVLNTVGVIDTSFYDEIPELDAMVLMGLAGPEGGLALVEILEGSVTPSGKTSYTWAKNYSDYPSTSTWGNDSKAIAEENGLVFQTDGSYSDGYTLIYYEGIYNGYRYFDTFNVEPAYEFGYGMSYTDFDIKTNSVKVIEDYVYVNVTVQNIGDTYSGKEVVQVYFSAPDGELEKPYQELAGYGKTDELKPGASQTLTISFPLTEMSSYSEEKAAYIMDAGDYLIRVGDSSRNTSVESIINLDKLTITEQLSNQLTATVDFDELSKEGVEPFSYETEAAEIAAAPIVKIYSSDIPCENNASEFDDETAVTYRTQALLDAESEIDEYYSDSSITSVSTGATSENGLGEDIATRDGGYGDGSRKTTLDFVYSDNYRSWSANSPLITATTDKTGSNGYRNGEGYDEEIVVVDEIENMNLLGVYNGEYTLEEFVGNMTVEQLIAVVIGVGENSTKDWGFQITKRKGGTAGNTTGAFMSEDVYGDGWIDEAYNNASTFKAAYFLDNTLTVEKWNDDEWESLGIPDINMADGPGSVMGTRITTSYEDGSKISECASAWPAGTVMASTFNNDLIYLAGTCSGYDLNRFDCSYWLAPGLNLIRNPLCGRNLEYFSEDPLLTGLANSATIAGVQSVAGVGVFMKHFALNNTENQRVFVNTIASERCKREIYLKAWEISVKSVQPTGIMTSYNVIEGTYAGGTYDLVYDILRGEWGFDGVVVTDWTTSAPIIDSMHVGNDLIMPGGEHYNYLIDAVNWVAPTFLDNGEIQVNKFLNYGPKSCYYELWGDFVPTTVGTEGDTSVSDEELTALYVSESDQAEGWHVVSYTPRYKDNASQMSSYTLGSTHYVVKTDDNGNITDYMGSYEDNSVIYIGDIQKCAINVLKLIMQSRNMANYYGDEVDIKPYSEKYDNLKTYLNVEKDDAVNITVSAPETASTGETFEILATTTKDIAGFCLYNESGNKVTLKSVEAVPNSDNTISWTIKTSVSTAGSRELILVPVSENTGYVKEDGVIINIEITDVADPVSIISAGFTVKAAAKNSAVTLTAVTGHSVNRISVQNENGSNMGKKLVSKVRHTDGTITWTYSMSIGTAGDRTFSIFANNQSDTTVSVNIIIV